MNKLLCNICNYNIIVVEQIKGDQFNIGKLKNIGFDYLEKLGHLQNYDNVIFTDIDIIPDSKLLKYYFKITNSLNSLASFGTRYDSQNKFAGALISSTPDFFKQLNGFPNNYWGWGDEDTNILLRLSEISTTLYANKDGYIIDLEEINNRKKTIDEKMDELKTNKLKENNIYEKGVNYKNFKQNGLTNLNYDIVYENKYNVNNNTNYHIIIDPKFMESQQKYPQDYVFKEDINKDKYRQIKKQAMDKITKVWF
jgi:hypothetical protein